MNIKMKDEMCTCNKEDSDVELCKEDLDRFLKDNNIHMPHMSSEQLYENFLLFQKFMNYRLTTSSHSKSRMKTYRNSNVNLINNNININNSKLNSTLGTFNEKRIRFATNTSPPKSKLSEASKRNTSELNSTKTTERKYNDNGYAKVKKPKIISQLKLTHNLKKAVILTNTSNKQLLSSASSKAPSLPKSLSRKNAKDTTHRTTINTHNHNNNNSASHNVNGNHSFNVHSCCCSNNTTCPCQCNSYIIKPIVFQRKQRHNCKIGLTKTKQQLSKPLKEKNDNDDHPFMEGLVLTCSSCSLTDDQSFTMKERNGSNGCLRSHINRTCADKDTIKIIDQQRCLDDKERFKEIVEHEVRLLQMEKEEVAKLKHEYSKLKQQLHQDIEEFNRIKQTEVEKWKSKANTKMKNSYSSSKQRTLHINTFPQAENETRHTNAKEEMQHKENTSRANIAQLQQQLNEANVQIQNLTKIINDHNTNNNSSTITNRYISNSNPHLPSQCASSISLSDKLSHLLHKSSPHKHNNNKSISPGDIKRNNATNSTATPPKQSPHIQSEIISNIIYNANLTQHQNPNHQHCHYNTTSSTTYANNEDNTNTNTGINFKIPSKYTLPPNIPVKSSTTENNRTIKVYSNGVKEILFKSGIKKRIFPDNYNIIYYTNNDIKQTFPDKHSVYLSSSPSDTKCVQKLFFNNSHTNTNTKLTQEGQGQSTTNLQNDTTEEMSSNETERTVKQNVFPNVQVSCTEIGNGVKEIKYLSGNKVYEFE